MAVIRRAGITCHWYVQAPYQPFSGWTLLGINRLPYLKGFTSPSQREGEEGEIFVPKSLTGGSLRSSV